MSKRKPRRFSKYVFEMISIIAGVLVALAVDEWNEDRENNQRAGIAMQNICSEMEKNLEVLEYLHPGNLAVLEVLNLAVPQDTNLQILPGLQLQETAWRTMESSGITAYLDYDELFEVAQIYSIQNIYKDLGKNYIDHILETKSLAQALGNELSESDVIRSSIELLQLMVTIEGSLMEIMVKYLDPKGLNPDTS